MIKIKYLILACALVIGWVNSAGAALINDQLQSDANLYFYGDGSSLALSPRTYSDVTPTNPSSPYDWMDGVGQAPLLLDVQAGSMLELSINGILNKQFSLGGTDYNLFFNADGEYVNASGDFVSNGFTATGFDLPYMSVVGAWLSPDGSGGFTPTYLNGSWDFVVGSAFDQLVPNNVAYLALGIINDNPLDTTGAFNVNGSVTAVPLPGAVWLLVSALMGMLAFRRSQPRADSSLA